MKQIEKKTTQKKTDIERAHAVLDVATAIATQRQDELGSATAGESAAERAVAETDSVEAMEWLDAATKLARVCRIRLKKAEAERASARAEVDRLEREEKTRAFAAAREASGDRPLRERVEPLSIEYAVIHKQLAVLEQKTLEAVIAQRAAVDLAHRIGRELGMVDEEVSRLLISDRGAMGFNPQLHDRSERRPLAAVGAWISLLSELKGPNPPALDDVTESASRTGAALTKGAA